MNISATLNDRAETLRSIRGYLHRVGPGNYDDLVASIFLECWQEHLRTPPLTDMAVHRAADRVRQRLLRSIRRAAVTPDVDVTASHELPPEEEVALVLHEFHAFLRRRSVHDALLFQRYYLDGQKDVAALAAELNTSQATLYRRLKAIRDDFLASRDATDPPNGVG